MARYSFTIEQDGMVVASGQAFNRAEAQREGVHYFQLYRDDGPATLKITNDETGVTVPEAMGTKR